MTNPDKTPDSYSEADTVGDPGDYTETDFGDGKEKPNVGEGEYTETDFGDGAQPPTGGKGEYTESDLGKGGKHAK
ncbi:hypothetical protein GCM10009717_02100 [Agromyces allii]|uniref:Uncharacterized protein n=2 Tax=Agromyces allii TaxID=393607 RepID=A0ABN2Q257_9MICO